MKPAWLITLDESMSAWTGRGFKGAMDYKPGFCPHKSWVPQKPEPDGVEYKTACCAVSGVMIAAETEEGKQQMKQKRFVGQHQHHTAVSLRLVEKLFGSGCVIVGDSWFSSVNTAVAMKENGLFYVGNVKTATSMFPKVALLDHTPVQHGEAIIYQTVFKGVTLYAVGVRKGKKKVRMLISTCGTSLVAGQQKWSGYNEDGFRYTVTKPQIDIDYMYTLAQPHVDVHNKLRQANLEI